MPFSTYKIYWTQASNLSLVYLKHKKGCNNCNSCPALANSFRHIILTKQRPISMNCCSTLTLFHIFESDQMFYWDSVHSMLIMFSWSFKLCIGCTSAAYSNGRESECSKNLLITKSVSLSQTYLYFIQVHEYFM